MMSHLDAWLEITPNIGHPTTVSLVAGIMALLATVIWHQRKSANLPPGPMYIPYFGTLGISSGPRNPETFKKLADKYGKICSFYSSNK